MKNIVKFNKTENNKLNLKPLPLEGHDQFLTITFGQINFIDPNKL